MTLQITSVKEFPSKQAEAIQKHLLELDGQDKLLDYFKEQYTNLGAENSLANYILKHWNEDGKKLYLEWTGIETLSDKHTIKRTGVKLSEISYGSSNRYFLWKCGTCKYEWVTKPNMRTSKNLKQGCPSCGGTSLIKGKNDLETYCKEHPEYQKLLTEFMGKDIDGNKILTSEISKGSRKEVWWKCSNTYCSYEWTTKVASRTDGRGRGCPACSRNQLIKGVNDLETYCTKQYQELNYILAEFVGIDENKQPILPSEIARGSNKRVYWKCNKCHKRWLATPNDRTNHKTGCPHCNKIGTSFPEQYIYHSLLQLFPNTKNRQKDIIKHYEYDIVIPELNLCIEYSGYGWHKDKLERDQAKANNCEENGAHFLQIYGHIGDMIEQDTYTKEKIIYQALNNKSQHIKQLQHIIEYILQEYAPNHSIQEIDFTLAEQQANEVMGKA